MRFENVNNSSGLSWQDAAVRRLRHFAPPAVETRSAAPSGSWFAKRKKMRSG
jgi:hypothetical protein